MNTDHRFSLQPGMIDSHFHLLHMEKKEPGARELLAESFRQGLTMGLEVGIVPATFRRREEIVREFPGLFLASGLYPSESENPRWRELLPALEEHLRHYAKAAALGEIGLDFHHGYGSREEQLELLDAQLELANRLEVPVVIHSRDAGEETLAALKSRPPRRGGIMHCYSYSPEETVPYLDLGMYISFAGNITYKNSTGLREAAAAVPDHRLLVETDAPYLSPLPVRSRMNHPGHIGYTCEVLAEVRRTDLSRLTEQLESNFREFLSRSSLIKELP